jgi:predicted N-acetyltransferase YhbS
MRAFAGPADFLAISDFLHSLYQPDNRDGNWLQPIWEYAYTHPLFDEDAVSRIGIWEAKGAIVAVASYELQLGEAFFQIDPASMHLKPEMLSHAEQLLTGTTDEGKQYLKAFVNDWDTDFEQVMRSRGYEKDPASPWPKSQLVIPDPFPPILLPDGFQLKSLADDNDLAKIDRCLWRGFNHPGDPPADSIQGRKKMQSGPNFRKDLMIVVEAPNGDFAVFSGLWFDPINRIAYVEPVATDPDYRRMGLGSAAVLEGIRRCGEDGATVAYVGSELPFYLTMGFNKLFTQNCWVKKFSSD